MTRERRTSQRLPASRSFRSRLKRFALKLPWINQPPVSQRSRRGSRKASGPSPAISNPQVSAYPVPSSTILNPSPLPPSDAADLEELPQEPRPRSNVFANWQFWAGSTAVVFAGVGFISATALFKPAALPNCPSIFWPLASASVRLSCAQIAANKQTVKNLLEAIALVHELPTDHPLRPEINRSIEQWALEILRLSQNTFNAGNLTEAINTARQIPADTTVYGTVQEQIGRWQSTWSQAETIYRQSIVELQRENWRDAFMKAVRLLAIPNEYWQTTKYQELTHLIKTAREDGLKLDKARRLQRRGTASSLMAAITLVEEVQPDSYVYQVARKLIVTLGNEMLDLAQVLVDRRDLQGAIALANRIPFSTSLQPKAQDFMQLARAQALTWSDRIPDLEAAITEAQKVAPARPMYSKAQQLIARWQQEIEAIAFIERAQLLAQPGDVGDLVSAIAVANQVPQKNPRWQQARKLVSNWTNQIQTVEDRPYLTQADQLAAPGDIISLQAAVDRAKEVGQGRALYAEAQTKVRTWTRQIQTIQDQPYLDRALELAGTGNLPDAIQMAARIASGRALYGDAQAQIKAWQTQINAKQNLQEAYRLGRSSAPEAIAAAIRAANQVDNSTTLRSEADDAISLWSQRLYDLAQEKAQYDVQGAIALAKNIPPSTALYAEVQRQIAEWRRSLVVPALPPVPSPQI
ncbi:MAG: hypothetical protein VKJ46_10200 [Leptolyngbyaceae bacterium]|nr:hypothetical protein [Leptolyngbyaceae bacterium]